MKHNNQNRNKNNILILIGQLVTIPFMILIIVRWIQIGADPITILVLLVALMMLLISITLQIGKVANTIGKES